MNAFVFCGLIIGVFLLGVFVGYATQLRSGGTLYICDNPHDPEMPYMWTKFKNR